MRSVSIGFLFLCAFFLWLNCQQPDPALEEQKIKKAIEKETQAFLDNDFKAWCSSYVQAPYAQLLGVDQNSVTELVGWQAMETALGQAIKGEPKPSDTKITRKNFIIRNYGTGAWVTYDQWWGVDPEKNPDYKPTKQLRILEKVGGEWKLIFMGHIGRFGD